LADQRKRRFLDLVLGAGIGFGANFLYSVGETGILRNKVFEANRKLVENEAAIARLKNDLDDALSAKRDYARLLRTKVGFGGGTNLKMMKNAKGEDVPMREVFSFDPYHVSCKVEDVAGSFVLPTHSRGPVNVEAHGFFMVMESNSLTSVTYGKDAGGRDQVKLKGTLDCATAAATATVSIGSKSAYELAQFEAIAVDGGVGGGKAGDSFAITVFFEERTAPVQYSIFGAEFTFTGKMIEGEITITEISKLLQG